MWPRERAPIFLTIRWEQTQEDGGVVTVEADLCRDHRDEIALKYPSARDVSGLSFDRRNMEKARLDGVTAVGTRFFGAWLKSVSMRGANLTGAIVTGACLEGADLQGATLDGADFRGADVRGADVDTSQISLVSAWPTLEQSAASRACAETARPRR